MLSLNFYNVTDDPRTLEKTLGSPVHSVGANLLDNCSVHDPRLVLRYSSELIGANYFEIVEWNTFYFMGDPVVSPGGRCLITGREDVLMTNKDKILALNAYCSRCESKFERYAVDSKVPSLVKNVVDTYRFSLSPFTSSNFSYLLTVKGGKVTS